MSLPVPTLAYRHGDLLAGSTLVVITTSAVTDAQVSSKRRSRIREASGRDNEADDLVGFVREASPRGDAMSAAREDNTLGEQPDESPHALVLPANARDDRLGGSSSVGVRGLPFDRRSPFFIGLTGAFGVAAAYLVVRGLADIADILVLIGLSLFIAIGLNPILEVLMARGIPRKVAVGIVTLGFALIAAAFVLAAAPPISREVQNLVNNYPRYRADALAKRGWIGHLTSDLHLNGYLNGTSKLKLPVASGVLGASKVILSVGVGSISVIVLTIYFLAALPAVREFFLGTIPRTRRERVSALTDEVFQRVGGFMLGNLLTSLVSGAGTYIWLIIFHVPYPLLLALLVALFDLIPMVGSTIAGIAVSLVALTRGVPIAITTAVFYIVYRFLEDYLLNPRVMKHTVRISPGLTIIATLIGGALLGIIGALVAIPIAATLHLLYEEILVPRQNTR